MKHHHDEERESSSCKERNNTRKATVVRPRKSTVVKQVCVLNPPPFPEKLLAKVPKIPPPVIPEEHRGVP